MTGRRSISLALTALTVLLLLVASGASAATPGEVNEFAVPACTYGDLAPAASEGTLVLLCKDLPGGRRKATLGKLLPSGKVTEGPIPQGLSGPLLAGPEGEIWAGTGNHGGSLGVARVAADGTVTRFALGTAAEEKNTLEIYGMVADGAGAVWIATGELAPEWYFHPFDSLGGELVHIAADGTVTHFPVPEYVEPQALTRGPDGNLWFVGESGRYATEHTSSSGKSYVGRMTPAGEFALYPTPTEESAPGAIAVGPDGKLWFTEASYFVRGLASISTDGTFGPSFRIHVGVPAGPLTFGPEGDAWASLVEGGTVRLTPTNQETVFPEGGSDVVTAPEGDIWTLHGQDLVDRIVPGAPGIDVTGLEARRPRRSVHLRLDCGGSTRGCVGTLELATPTEERGTATGATIAQARFSVPAESHRGLTLVVPGKTFGSAVVVRATVARGPTLERRLNVPAK